MDVASLAALAVSSNQAQTKLDTNLSLVKQSSETTDLLVNALTENIVDVQV